MKKIIAVLVMLLVATAASAQVSVPNTFSAGSRILASEMNANFDALESGSLNRDGGTITGNITVDSGVTIDGIDIGAVLGGTGTPTFSTLTTTGNATIGGTLSSTGNFAVNTTMFTVAAASGNTAVAGTLAVTGAQTMTGATTLNGAVDVNSTFTIGSGNVTPFDSTGKIQAISSTYFASLDGTNLTGVAKLAGGPNTFTGQNDFLDYTETFTSPTISGGALTLNLNNGSHFTVALNANTSITVSNVPASKAVSFTLQFTADGTSRTVTWPSGTVWAQGAAPTLTSTNGKRDFFTFITYDGGTTWFGFVGGQNF